MKITHAQVLSVRVKILAAQGHECPLCHHPLRSKTTKKKPALDHNHDTGYIRGVLCINCNGSEGRIMRRAKIAAGQGNDPLEWLKRMCAYLEEHKIPKWSAPGRRGLIHPTHKTENEKRLSRLAKAKTARRRRTAAAKVKG